MPSKHINADFMFMLHEMEQELFRMGRTIVKDWKHLPTDSGKAREMGRAAGFFAAATIISGRINKSFS